MKTDGILLDLDGTLWDAVEGVLVAWNEVIVRHPGLRPPLTAEELRGYMGLPMDEIARRMFPRQTEGEQAQLMDACCQREHEYLAVHGGRVFDGVEQTLAQLSRRFPLCIVSNCEDGYIQCFLQVTGLGKSITDFESFGATGLSKGENIQLVARRNGLQAPIYVGDTAGDQQAARQAGVPFVFAQYGFGQAHQPDHTIGSMADLPGLLQD